MTHLISKVNTKVENMQRGNKSNGYSPADFPGERKEYPQLAEYSDKFWKKVWHNERKIEYYRGNDYWLSTTLYSSSVLAKQQGRIFLDLEYFSMLESIAVRVDEYSVLDEIIIELNNSMIGTYEIEGNITLIKINEMLLTEDYLTVYLTDNKPALVQVKYRLIG